MARPRSSEQQERPPLAELARAEYERVHKATVVESQPEEAEPEGGDDVSEGGDDE